MPVYLLAVIAGFMLLVWGADRFVFGASSTARNLGVSPLIIGLTIVGFGTSAPEMLISAVAAWVGKPGLAVGNALGSNIANIGLVMGIAALVSPLVVHSDTLRREFPVLMSIMLIALALLSDGQLNRGDGIILLLGMGVMLYWMTRLGFQTRKSDPMKKEYDDEIPGKTSMRRAISWTLAGLVVLLTSSHMVVWGATNIAYSFGVDELLIGLTIVAIGTSLPELAASVMSVIKKEYDIALGNIIGSNMFNLLGVLGIPGVISPTGFEEAVLTRDFPMMIGLTVALFAMAYGFQGDGRINRIEGAALLAAYCGYLAVIYVSAV